MIKEAVKRLGGRPRKTPMPKKGGRVHLGFRVTPETKRRLEMITAKTGRSQSQEAEHRLELSFHDQDLLPRVLQLACGRPDLAALVQQFIEAAQAVELRHLREAGLPPAAPDLEAIVNELKRAHDAKERAATQPEPGTTYNIRGGNK